MFDNLSDKLQRVFKNLRGEGKLTAENMEAALREIRVALLEADVHFRVVKQFIEAVKEKAMGEEVLTALSPTQQVVKIVRDELVKMLGSHQSKLRMANEPPSVIMIVGLQGSGKTTSTGKAGALAVEERALADHGFGGRLPSRGAQAIERARARYQASDLRRHAGGDQARWNWRARRARSRARPAATCCWSIPPGACTSTIDLMTELQQLKDQLNPTEDPVRGRRDDRAGRGEIGRRVPQAAGHHGRHPHQDGRRCARRRGAVDPLRHRSAAEVRRRGREVRCAGAVPSGSRGAAHSGHGRRAVA